MKKVLLFMLLSIILGSQGAYAATLSELAADVPQSHWIYDDLQLAAKDSWLVSDGSGTFGPEGPASRKSVARMLAEAWETAQENDRVLASLPPAAENEKTFSDLSTADAVSQEAMKRLAAAGVLSGYPDGTIRPDGGVTRLEMAVMLSRIAKVPAVTGPSFTDAATFPLWGRAAIEKAAAMGLIAGYGDGTFRPQNRISRAEAVQMISRWVYSQKTAPVVPVEPVLTDEAAMAADIFRLINVERTKRGLSPLRVNPLLTQVAVYKATDMAEKNYFSHVSPSGEGIKALFTRFGVRGWSAMGENLLKVNGSVTAERAVAAWMQSGDHRTVILTPYTDSGIGFARAADGTVYIAQAFASF